MQRPLFEQRIAQGLKVHPVVALLGPRQCGKTTLARMYSKQHPPVTKFDLEDVRDLNKLHDSVLALEDLTGLIVLDEIQLAPEIFRTLRVLVDRQPLKQRYLILGSASPSLIKQSSETLAGRIEYIELTPFSYSEANNLNKLWLQGGFPRSYLATNLSESIQWRRAYIKTFLEKDIPNLGFNIPAQTLRRFWMMLAHYHGNIFNASELGRSFSVAHTTINNYLDILTDTFMIRQLQPWIENIKKRQVKSPKIYFRDSGIFHTLLDINTKEDLLNNPKLGASWEGFALEEIIRHRQAEQEECYFWATHSGAELDLLIFKDGKRQGFEFKYSSTPKPTKSMHIAQETLNLDTLTVIIPGNDNFPLTKDIQVFGIEKYLQQTT